eukprot:1143499-Pelagomonas_calceolata.AAC.5
MQQRAQFAAFLQKVTLSQSSQYNRERSLQHSHRRQNCLNPLDAAESAICSILTKGKIASILSLQQRARFAAHLMAVLSRALLALLMASRPSNVVPVSPAHASATACVSAFASAFLAVKNDCNCFNSGLASPWEQHFPRP